MRKSILLTSLALSLLLTACASTAQQPSPAPEAPEASAPVEEKRQGKGAGNNGEITVEVTTKDGVISSVEVLSHSETPGICDNALTEIPAAIVAANRPEVDVVSGATNTSSGIIQAVQDALGQTAPAQEPAEASGWRTWPGPGVYDSAEELAAFTEEAEQRMVETLLEDAPTVKTLENGVQIQAVPADARSWNVSILDAENRGCAACHTIEDALYNLPMPHSVLRGSYGESVSINTCINCHDQVFYGGYGITINIREAMHGLHMNSDSFQGNCLSCHYIDMEGEYQLWDNAKYSVLQGITSLFGYKGSFSFDQNVTVPAEDVYIHMSEQSDPNGITVIATDDADAYNSWILKLTGACANQAEIGHQEPYSLPRSSRILKNACIINGIGDGMIANCNVQGFDMNDLIEYAQVNTDANYVRFHTAENPSNPWILPLEIFDVEDNAILVTHIDNEPLKTRQGGPYSLWWGNYNGNVYIRNITEIEFIASEEPISYSMAGNITSMETLYPALNGCRERLLGDESQYSNCPNQAVFHTVDGQIFEAGAPITIEGFADAYAETVTGMSFSLDGGATWDSFETTGATKERWVYWYYTMDNLEPGSYVLTIRTVTDTGRVSPMDTKLLFHVQ